MSQNTYFEQMTGEPWSKQKKLHWFFNQIAQGRVRDYQTDVVARLKKLPEKYFSLEQYGHLTTDAPRYPLLSIKAGDFSNGKPNILITAGVHGYEPSGIEAVLNYLENQMRPDLRHSNFLIYPTISPWA